MPVQASPSRCVCAVDVGAVSSAGRMGWVTDRGSGVE